jgi:hypothetical protein
MLNMITCPDCEVVCVEPEPYALCEADRYHRCCMCGSHYTDQGERFYPVDFDRNPLRVAPEAPSLGALREANWKDKRIDRRRERRADRRRNRD